MRQRIRALDTRILDAWRERLDVARRIGAAKHAAGLPLQNFEVEKAVLENALADARRLGLPQDGVRELVRVLVESAVQAQEQDRNRKGPPAGKDALLIGGAGAMGSWFARFLEERGYQIFIEDPAASRHPRPAKGQTFQLIVIATPPSVLAEGVERARAAAAPTTLVVDIASIKSEGVPALRAAARAGVKIASLHPLFGPSVEVLAGRTILVMDCGHRDAVAEARALFATTAARLEEVPLEEHDALMADVLGLSHATNLVFNDALAHGPSDLRLLERAASTTFRKQVAIAREVARENPALYFEIQALNPENGAMLERLEGAVQRLRRLVAERDRNGFEAFMQRQAAFHGKEVSPRSR